MLNTIIFNVFLRPINVNDHIFIILGSLIFVRNYFRQAVFSVFSYFPKIFITHLPLCYIQNIYINHEIDHL